ncbi:MAG: hypothetical protein GAK28_04689 [Luteibacter sp.]|uniref:hypothetical protein n=1 Tax=Luteibacter sp. TaxID=1886636 RepID=UPI00137EC7C0|nr:hypothetical protein [Luteibacter sp.]KAF1003482.1 MAG: hypothetical protein GAK28_04689 [Luteibacter sp.]
MIRVAVTVVATLLLVSCTARLPLKDRNVGSLVRMTDDKKSRIIGVKLTNDSSSKWCIDDGDWPNHIGALDQLGDPSSGYAVTLTIDGKVHPVKQRNLGYCVGNCKIVVKPGETIAAEIPYSEFSVADDEVEKEKALSLPVAAVLCR